PMLYAALAFASGRAAGRHMWRPSSWWIVAAFVLIVGSIYYLRRRGWAALTLSLCALFCAGALTIPVRGVNPRASQSRQRRTHNHCARDRRRRGAARRARLVASEN